MYRLWGDKAIEDIYSLLFKRIYWRAVVLFRWVSVGLRLFFRHPVTFGTNCCHWRRSWDILNEKKIKIKHSTKQSSIMRIIIIWEHSPLIPWHKGKAELRKTFWAITRVQKGNIDTSSCILVLYSINWCQSWPSRTTFSGRSWKKSPLPKCKNEQLLAKCLKVVFKRLGQIQIRSDTVTANKRLDKKVWRSPY